jgi:Amt family ammonium transporter
VKNKLGYDDTLDVFGVHCIGGIVGAIGTGIVADPALGGQGWFDYGQVITQIKAVCSTYDRCGTRGPGLSRAGRFGVCELRAYPEVLRASTRRHRPASHRSIRGRARRDLDINEHGERAYN